MGLKKTSTNLNLILPQDIADEMQYFVDNHEGVTKKIYVSEAIRNFNMLQRQIEKFKKEHPGIRYEINVRIQSIDDDADDIRMRKAAILVY